MMGEKIDGSGRVLIYKGGGGRGWEKRSHINGERSPDLVTFSNEELGGAKSNEHKVKNG